MSRPQHKLVDLPQRSDPRGALTFAQQGDHIPFTIKRFFAIHGVADGASRGGHAHREQHQLLVMLAGTATVTVDDGTSRTRLTLDRPNLALHAPPMLWLELDNFSPDALCLVLTSDLYSEADYIRDRAEFLRQAG
jgi:dTDP-4-dehydrorhamnose 3,5-epimerase-like enzyme